MGTPAAVRHVLWWLLSRGLQNPCHSAPSSLSPLLCLVRTEGRELPGATNNAGAGDELSNITPVSRMRKTSWGKERDATEVANIEILMNASVENEPRLDYHARIHGSD